MTRTDDLKSLVPDDPNKILSEKDELKLKNLLIKNKNFILDLNNTSIDKITDKNNTNNFYDLPKYIGTDELEFNKFRKLSLINRRLKQKKLNNLKLINNKNTNTNTNNTEISGEKIKLNELSTPSTPKINSPIPESSKLLTPINQSQSQSQSQSQQQQQSQSQQPQSQSQTAPVTKWSLVVQNSLPNKSSINSKSNTHSSTPSAYASPSTSSSTTTMTTTETTTATTETTTTNRSSTNGSLTNGTSTNQLTSEIISQKSLSQSTIPMDNTLKPLGLILLRIMYDKYLLPSCLTKNKNQLVSPHGLTNNGSICFMNSILQLLFCCEPFIQILNLIRDGTLASFESNKTPVLDATINLLNLFKSKKEQNNNSSSSPSTPSTPSSSSYDIISPNNFYTSISRVNKFSHLKWGRQEDAEEFLGYFLDSIHEEFIESIENLKDIEIEKLLKLIIDKDTKRNITQALELIRSSSQTSNNSSTTTTTTTKEETNADDDDGWHEVGSNRKIVAKREVEVKPSPIVQLFGGQFRSVLSISNSKKSSITLDPFMHVQLDISDNETTDLISAFNKFSEIEEISYGNQMAKKQNFIDKLPMILIIHLKRFSYVTNDNSNNNNLNNSNNNTTNNSNITINNNDSNIADSDNYEVITRKKKSNNSNNSNNSNISNNLNNTILSPPSTSSSVFEGRIEKLHKIIKYDHELKLPKNCISPNNYFNQQPPNYKLTGVVYHHGRSAEGGHYTVDVLNQNEWFRVDDTQVTKINKSDVIENGLSGGNYLNNNKSAYILMYQRI
ncbi:unnamed protein product [[Candida] boidinii]|nr:unnamed protein product [[Candida] boidinii]